MWYTIGAGPRIHAALATGAAEGDAEEGDGTAPPRPVYEGVSPTRKALNDWKEKKEPPPKGGGKSRHATGGKGRGYADGTGGTGAGALLPDVLKHAAAVKRALTSKAAEARRKEEENEQNECGGTT